MSTSGLHCLLCAGQLVHKYAFGHRSIVYCRACRLGQLTPLPTDDELAALYGSRAYFEGTDQVGYADYAADAPQFQRTFQVKIQQLMRYGAVEDLLEVGCGPGYFLVEARRAGVANVVGVDRNPWGVDEARRKHLEVYVGSLEALAPGRSFDAVAMLDVLEHVTQPMAFLEEARKRLRPHGRILIMTPNIRSMLAHLSGQRWVSFKIPEHVYYYSPRSIRSLLERCGFDVLEVRSTGQYVTVAFLLSRVERLTPRLTTLMKAAANRLHLHHKVVFVTNGSIDVVARTRPAQ